MDSPKPSNVICSKRSRRSVELAGLRFLGLVDKHVLAPDFDCFHSDKGTFKECPREEHGVLVSETFCDEQTIARTTVIEQVESVGHARTHQDLSMRRKSAGPGGRRLRRGIVTAVPRSRRAPLRPVNAGMEVRVPCFVHAQ